MLISAKCARRRFISIWLRGPGWIFPDYLRAVPRFACWMPCCGGVKRSIMPQVALVRGCVRPQIGRWREPWGPKRCAGWPILMR